MTRDRYDQEIERVGEIIESGDTEALLDAWGYCDEHSPLFDALTPNRIIADKGRHVRCGCPTLIKCGQQGWLPELTKAVRNEPLIPFDVSDITVEALPVLAKIQRLADTLLNRRPPRLLPEIVTVGGPGRPVFFDTPTSE